MAFDPSGMVRHCSWPTQQQVHDVAAELSASEGVPLPSAAVVRVPYRICPIGAHVDHQGGCISGMALDFGVSLVFVRGTDRTVRMRSLNFSGQVTFSLDAIPPCRRGNPADEENCWGNFPRGAATALLKHGHRLHNGMSGVLLAPERLDSSGISSSAAVGCACLLALEHANGLKMSVSDNIELDRLIENEYLGLRNGIMDQSIVLGATCGHLTVVDCQSRRIQQHKPPWLQQGVPLPYAILLVFSGLRSALAGSSAFNDRVSECQAAASALLQHLGRTDSPPILGSISHAEYQEHKSILGATPAARRAEHYFSETARVMQGAQLWEQGDLVAFGQLMNLSGCSSAVNYEVGSEHLKFIQDFLHNCRGVLGARFSGAGTRGACVALVQSKYVEHVAQQAMFRNRNQVLFSGLIQVWTAYTQRYPELTDAAQIIASTSGDGFSVVPLEHKSSVASIAPS